MLHIVAHPLPFRNGNLVEHTQLTSKLESFEMRGRVTAGPKASIDKVATLVLDRAEAETLRAELNALLAN